MPPKNNATTRSAKKGKAVKKKVSAVIMSEHKSEEEEPSMKDMFQNLTAMMTSLNQMDGGGRKKRKVAFHSRAPVPDTSLPPDAASTAASQPPTSLMQPHGHRTEQTSKPAVTQQLAPTVHELVSQETAYQEGAPPHTARRL